MTILSTIYRTIAGELVRIDHQLTYRTKSLTLALVITVSMFALNAIARHVL